jgi:predicted nucleic acid-binding protein
MLYAESSAVLAWLLGEPAGEAARGELAAAKTVIASALTLVECDRALLRAVTVAGVSRAAADRRRRLLAGAASRWAVARVLPEHLDRARQPFPREPVRTLDALHLATALSLRAEIGEIVLLSLDSRVRANAEALGFPVLPVLPP